MPKYEILAREIVYYAFEVEADNEEQAMQEAYNYELTFNDATDADYFEIDSIEEKTNA